MPLKIPPLARTHKLPGWTFKRAAGTAEHLAEEADRRGIGWMCSPGNPLGLSASP
jgi:hypothetical protein